MVVEVPELLVDWAGDGFQVATVEVGSPARVAGPFTNFLACRFVDANDRVSLDPTTAPGIALSLHDAWVHWDEISAPSSGITVTSGAAVLVVRIGTELVGSASAITGISSSADGAMIAGAQAVAVSGSNENRAELWYLPNPTAGAHTFTVTYAALTPGDVHMSAGTLAGDFAGIRSSGTDSGTPKAALSIGSLTFRASDFGVESAVSGSTPSSWTSDVEWVEVLDTADGSSRHHLQTRNYASAGTDTVTSTAVGSTNREAAAAVVFAGGLPLLDETLGCVLVGWDPDSSGNAPHTTRLFSWGDTTDDRISAWVSSGTQVLSVSRRASSSGGTYTASAPLVGGTKRIDGMAWSASSVYTIAAATLGSANADANIPDLTTGIRAGNRTTAEELEGAISFLITLSRLPTQAELDDLDALTRPPLFGEIFGRAMAGLWLGQGSTYYDDARDIVTPELRSFSTSVGDRAGVTQIRQGRAGKFGASVQNAGGRYSPSNVGSPLTGLIVEGRDVRLRMASLADHHDLWYGRLEEPARARWQRRQLNRTTLRASGMLRQLRNRNAVLPDQLDQDTGAIVSALFAASPDVSALAGTIATGATTLAVFFPENAATFAQVIKALEQQELGWLRETRAGLLDFDDRHYRRTGARLTPAATISDAGGAALTQTEIQEEQPARNQVNSSIVGVRQFAAAPDSAVLWSYAGPAISIVPGASVIITAAWPSPITDPDAGYVSTWETILESDMTLAGVTFGDLTITVLEGGRQLEITIANGGGADADITTLDVRGVGIRFLDPIAVSILEATDPRRMMPNPPTWLSSVSEGEAFNEHVTTKLNPPPQVLRFGQRPRRAADSDLAALLEVDLSDRVTVVADNITQFGVDGDFHVELIEHRWRHAGDWEMLMRVSAVDPVPGWILGDATLSELGVTTVLTY